MILMPYNAEYSMLTLSTDVTHPGCAEAVVRYYVEVLEAHPHHGEVQRLRAKRALEDANHPTDRN
jgi:uncharacterized protein YbjT (DUF2867 family)